MTHSKTDPFGFIHSFLASLVVLHFTPVSHTLGGSLFWTSIALRLAIFSEPDTFIHQTFPGMPDHYGVHILEVDVYRLVPMRGPTIKSPSGPRQEHRQHLRLANYTSFTLDRRNPWGQMWWPSKTVLVVPMVAVYWAKLLNWVREGILKVMFLGHSRGFYPAKNFGVAEWLDEKNLSFKSVSHLSLRRSVATSTPVFLWPRQ